MDYITDYISNNAISYNIYDELFYKTHLYIVNNMNRNNYINNIYDNHDIYDDDEIYDDDDSVTTLQYFNIMSFLEEFV